ncbi:MAG: hypothetical protein JOZ80_08890 [Acidobacteriaceae bacterium]|nr:hypothetical protein [Acidobacteriaceae bacterium]
MADSDWRDLCERITRERDPEQLMTLVEELNRTLAQQERELRPLAQSEISEQYP